MNEADRLLARMRDVIAGLRAALDAPMDGDPDLAEIRRDEVDAMVEYFETMDASLSSGEPLPSDWSR